VYFLGVFVKPYCVYIGKKTKHNFYEKIREWNKENEKNGGVMEKCKIEKFVACVNSYLGIMKHYKTHFLRKKMMMENVSLWWWSYVFCGVSFNFNKIEIIKKNSSIRCVEKV
jgi:hypothetical protein